MVVARVGLGEDDIAVDDCEAVVVGRAAVDPERESHGPSSQMRWCAYGYEQVTLWTRVAPFHTQMEAGTVVNCGMVVQTSGIN